MKTRSRISLFKLEEPLAIQDAWDLGPWSLSMWCAECCYLWYSNGPRPKGHNEVSRFSDICDGDRYVDAVIRLAHL